MLLPRQRHGMQPRWDTGSGLIQQERTCILDGDYVLIQALHETPAGLLVKEGYILPEHSCQVAVADAIRLAGPCSQGSSQMMHLTWRTPSFA